MKILRNYKSDKVVKFVQTAVVSAILSGTSAAAQALDAVGYYSDNNSDLVYIVDPRNMSLVDTIATTGNQPYPIDKVGGSKVYVTTRNSESLDIIDYDGANFANTGIVPLTHKPRSVAYNASANLAAVSGTKKAVMSIIDVANDTVVGTVGNTDPLVPSGFGGSLATGHPVWVSDNQFMLIDRARRLVHLYKISQSSGGAWNIVKTSSISSPTSIHHFASVPSASNWFQKRTFYGMGEGAPAEGKHPSVFRVFVLGNLLLPIGNADMDASNAADQGSHHLGMHPNKVHVYAGSKEGAVYVVNRYTMGTEHIVAAGANAGHTTFNTASGLAVQTNHRDDFMTLIDMNTHSFINDVTTASTPTPSGQLAQSHTTSFDPSNAGVYYTAAAADGNYVEVDAVSGTVTRTLPLDFGNGYTIQGTYNWNLQ